MVDRDKKKYACPWPNCRHEFEKEVGTSSGDKRSHVSTHVICPKCKGGLKTFD